MTDAQAEVTVTPVFSEPRSPRVFLVVVDETPELAVALRYASIRARKTGGRVALLYVIEPADFQEWAAIGDLMRQEAYAEAERTLIRVAAETVELTGALPGLYLREGNRRDELLRVIEEDASISILILGAAASGKGPGPLVDALTDKFVGKLRVPVTIVPGNIPLETIDQIA